MKKKNKSSSDLVTKAFLEVELEVMETKIDIKLDQMEKRIDYNAQKYRDQILTKLDGVSKELEQTREDRIVGENQTKEKLGNHEKRIRKLEQFQQIA